MASRPTHVPVLLNETIDALELGPGENVVDCTVGGGGHAEAILERIAPDGRLLGIDLDEAALGSVRRRLSRFGSRVMLVHGNYRDVGKFLLSSSFGPVHAALLDLGFSSIIIDDPSRGFSFRSEGPLDMRYDRGQELTAAGIVNGWTEDEIAKVLWEYGEERHARRIAAAIVRARKTDRITGTMRLAGLVREALPPFRRRGRTHPATQTFQALRIAVNDEFGNIRTALHTLFGILEPGGRIAIITFHSLEDRIVKRFIRDRVREDATSAHTAKPIVPSVEEIRENPRARSAKLRAVRKRT